MDHGFILEVLDSKKERCDISLISSTNIPLLKETEHFIIYQYKKSSVAFNTKDGTCGCFPYIYTGKDCKHSLCFKILTGISPCTVLF